MIVFFNEFIWYSFVACAFSVERFRQRYAQLKTGIDRVTGGFLGILGVKLLAE